MLRLVGGVFGIRPWIYENEHTNDSRIRMRVRDQSGFDERIPALHFVAV
ncbi:MAG: hypothetical protein ACT6FE_02490 [Methanosarcinaceae archaeon]